MRSDEARINVNLSRVNQDEDGGTAVVPELPMKAGDILSLDTLNELEIDKRNICNAQNPVKLEQVKRPAQDVTLRRVQTRRIEFHFAGEERFCVGVADAKLISPIVRLSHLAHRTTDCPDMGIFLSLT